MGPYVSRKQNVTEYSKARGPSCHVQHAPPAKKCTQKRAVDMSIKSIFWSSVLEVSHDEQSNLAFNGKIILRLRLWRPPDRQQVWQQKHFELWKQADADERQQ